MFRELTYSDVSRAKALAGAEVSFVMDEEAFRGFYDRNARGLWAYLSRVTGDRQLADDLLQDAFYRFLRAASNAGGEDRFDSDAHRRNSLYRIATNLAVDARRRSFTRPAASVTGDDVERIAASGQSGHSGDHGEDAARRADVNRAMAQLRPRDRAMLWMAYAEGASHDEIAGAIGVQPSSMKLLLFRARKKMAKLLGEKGVSQ